MNLYNISHCVKNIENPIYISLGSDCSIAYHIQKLGLKTNTYPFDWIQTPDIKMLSLLLKNNFNDLFSNLLLDGTNLSCLIHDEWNEYKQIIIKLKNIKYNINFNNDLASIIYSQRLSINDIKQKYNKRIKKFYKTMSDNTKYKKLYRIGNTNEVSELRELDNIFKNNTFTNYTIYFVPNNLKIIDNIDYIPIIDISEINNKNDTWKKAHYNWLTIFNEPHHNY